MLWTHNKRQKTRKNFTFQWVTPPHPLPKKKKGMLKMSIQPRISRQFSENVDIPKHLKDEPSNSSRASKLCLDKTMHVQ